MPKRTEIHHITVHLYHSSVLLSVPESTSVAAIRAQLVPAIAPLAPHIPIAPPATADDLQLWEDREAVEGAEGDQGIRLVDSTDKTTVLKMGWPRWKRLFVSIRGPDGTFSQPEYTIPDPTDGDDDEVPAEL
ncbi:uncharacterized protein EHS24_004468 [Apiotrichum porosum]|uniref:Uncharacterized protein n=1 Tax=Apiotrichum porosum TaxID=105984 RepID=A0A427Y568_9TREE|nr:uncharacterized protein EHS24_004468 [Apiotrichum porosum]RSH86231.1 hypothetical protein EHS24_004468 [Apiotrichum porosum]